MKTNYKTLGYWFRDMLNFNFSEKSLGLISPPHFVYDFSRKLFLMLHSINWPNFIFWLSLLLEILDNMCIAIIFYPGCDVIKLSFLSSRFATWPKSQHKNLNILKTRRALEVKQKALFIIFKCLSVATNSLRPESASLKLLFQLGSP